MDYETGTSPCPRCGSEVAYKGRGRRPIWCSTKCRVEASVARRGNRMVGIEPKVVEVVRVKAVAAPPAPPPPAPATPILAPRSGRRPVQAWTEALAELRTALASGAVYDRELDELAPALSAVLDAMTRRMQRR